MSQGDFTQAGFGPLPGFAAVAPLAASGAAPLAAGDARGAIARAARATGVDFNYLLAQAKIESRLDPHARAGTSSAAGLYQFTQGTWARVLERHGAEAGLDGALPGGALAALRDPAQRARLMALRFDPEASARMAAELASDHQGMLTDLLGRAPKASELYLAHFLGADGASRFLRALASDPSQSGAGLLPRAAAANRGIFYDAGGSARPVGAIMALIDGKMASAMQDAGNDAGFGPGFGPGFGDAGDPMAMALSAAYPPTAPTPDPATGAATPASPAWAGPVGAEFARVQAGAQGGGSSEAPPRPSMAETLGAAFGLGGPGRGTGSGSGSGNAVAPEFVRSAYGRLRAMGL